MDSGNYIFRSSPWVRCFYWCKLSKHRFRCRRYTGRAFVLNLQLPTSCDNNTSFPSVIGCRMNSMHFTPFTYSHAAASAISYALLPLSQTCHLFNRFYICITPVTINPENSQDYSHTFSDTCKSAGLFDAYGLKAEEPVGQG